MPGRLPVLAALSLVASFSALAQEQSCQRRTLPLALRDKENLPIQDVSPADFSAKLHGKPVKILSLAPDSRPHRLVLILDASGSMGSSAGEPPRWKLAFALARHFFELNSQKSQIALIIFNDQLNEVVDFTPGNSAVAAKLEQLARDHDYVKANVKGHTALYDAIFRGLQLLDRPTSADALYVLTDGGDNVSTHRFEDVNQRLAAISVRLFAVILEGGHRMHAPEEDSGSQAMSELARKSGGEVLSAAEWYGDRIALTADSEGKWKTAETLSRLYQTILQDRLLEIELPSAIAKTERWELKLSDNAQRQWKGAQLTYSTRLLGCDSEVYGSGRH
jgi:Mg-chelatase subunit ChlD